MNIQFYVTEREAGKIAGMLECTTDKIGRVLKASLLEKRTSPNFRELIQYPGQPTWYTGDEF